jgi:hypothetical protein
MLQYNIESWEFTENNELILGNNGSIFGEILNRMIGRKIRIIGTALD